MLSPCQIFIEEARDTAVFHYAHDAQRASFVQDIKQDTAIIEQIQFTVEMKKELTIKTVVRPLSTGNRTLFKK